MTPAAHLVWAAIGLALAGLAMVLAAVFAHRREWRQS